MSELIPTQLQLTPSVTPVKAYQNFAISVALTAGQGLNPTSASVSLTIRDDTDNEVYSEDVIVSFGNGSTSNIQLPAGTYSVTASYAGDEQYEGSDDEYTQEVEKDDVTGTITVVPSNPTAGQQVQITIQLNPATTGTGHQVDGDVQLIVNGVDVGSHESLTDGSYTTNYTFTTAGSVDVKFEYSGSDDYNPNDFTQTVQVQAIPTTLSIAVNPEPSWIGQSTQLQFTVTSEDNVGPINGTITVIIGNDPPAELAVTDGSANINYAFSGPPGPVTISATFAPETDSPYGGSENAVDHEVVLIPTETVLTLDPNSPIKVRDNLGFLAEVTADDDSTVEVGSVTFSYDGTGGTGDITINIFNGKVTYDTTNLPAGQYVLRAVYNPGGNYAGSESQPQDYLIERYDVAVAIVPSKNPSLPGENVNFTVIVNGVDSGNLPLPPGGNVTLSVGPTQVGSKLLSEGQALFENISLTEGDHEITASYEGDADYLPGEGQLTQMVVKGDVAVVLTVDPTETTEGNQITFSVQVSPVAPNTVTPQGTVVLYADNTPIGDATLDEDGKAVISYSGLAVGPHTVWAVYGGSQQYNTNESDEIAITITQTPREPTETTIVQDVTLSLYGAPVTFTAMVTAQNEGVQNPTSGPVTFYRDGISIGDENLDEANTALITTNTLPPGIHNITAYYGGNNEYDESISDPIQHTVQAETVTTVTPYPPSPSYVDQTVTFTITVRTKVGSPYIPQGEVRLYIDGASPGSATLNGEGNASFQHTFEEVGTYTYHAEFLGDEIYLHSESDSAQYVTYALPTELTLTSNYNPSWYGQMVTFTARVTPPPPEGSTVSFIIEGNQHGPVPVGEDGTAQLKIATLAPGYHQVVALFTGDNITLTASLRQVVYYCCRN